MHDQDDLRKSPRKSVTYDLIKTKSDGLTTQLVGTQLSTFNETVMKEGWAQQHARRADVLMLKLLLQMDFACFGCCYDYCSSGCACRGG